MAWYWIVIITVLLVYIYIDPFQKHGYTRTAKKVIEERNNNETLER